MKKNEKKNKNNKNPKKVGENKNRGYWAEIAKNTLEIIEKGCVYISKNQQRIDFLEEKNNSMEKNQLFTDDYNYEEIKFEKGIFKTEFKVVDNTCLAACFELLREEEPEKLMLLNFAR